jgi:hypothetical protein
VRVFAVRITEQFDIDTVSNGDLSNNSEAQATPFNVSA